MDSGMLTVLAQFGFAGVMAFAIARAYQELVTRLLAVIEANTRASTQMLGAIETNTRSTETLIRVVHDLDGRLEALEHERVTRLPNRRRVPTGEAERG